MYDAMSGSHDYAVMLDDEIRSTSFIIPAETPQRPMKSDENDVRMPIVTNQGSYKVIELDSKENPAANNEQSSKNQQDEEVEEEAEAELWANASSGKTKSPAFRIQARMSKLLQNDYSSSDGEGTSEESPPTSTRKQTTSIVHNSISGVTDESIETSDSEEESESEIVPMRLLSKIVKPAVISEVKHRLKKVVTKINGRPVTISADYTPAKLWELKKKRQNDKARLKKNHESKINAGWKVRECIASLQHGENINTLYLTFVRRKMYREVDALFGMAKVIKSKEFLEFDKNFLDGDCKSALIIAIDMKDETMLRKLLEHDVDAGLSIFHAIEEDFMEGLKLILKDDPCNDLKITTGDPHFQIGMTPMMMAAHENNYRALSLLHQHGHRLTGLPDCSGKQIPWEQSNEKIMIIRAKAQPAYITHHIEVSGKNPMDYCFEQLKSLRHCEAAEREFGAFYKELRCKYEDYMCSLLDFISSSDELSDLFEYKTIQPRDNSFELLEKASREKLIRFVTHQQSQVALSHGRYRNTTYLRNTLAMYAISLLFPLLSVFHICAPKSHLGSQITCPNVSFYCNMMSDLMFALLLLLKILVRDVHFDRLGEPVSFLEGLIFLWIVGKWVQELQECVKRGLKSYFSDNWNYTDLTFLSLFTVSMVIRLYDAIYNAELEHISRYEWEPLEPRLIGEGMQAFGYVFLFLRLLSWTRADRYLGPLQISLGKMLKDVVRFLCLFALVLGAFAFGLSDLYWYYGTSEGAKLFCNETLPSGDRNATRSCKKQDVAFTSILSSMENLFWALFGLFDLEKMSLQGKHVYTEFVGIVLVAIYHVVAIIVMLNMLIAMMSKTYEDTSENEEIAWNFHRASVWIRYIRGELIRPPPMNLLPNPWKIKEIVEKFINYCRHGRRPIDCESINTGGRLPSNTTTNFCINRCYSRFAEPPTVLGPKPTPSQTFANSTHYNSQMRKNNEAAIAGAKTVLQLKSVQTKLVLRYKIKYLTKKR